MLRYIVRRVAVSVPLLFILSILTFGLALLMPGDFVVASRPLETVTATTVQSFKDLRELYGLNRTPVEQYVDWMGQVLRGNFGYSLYYGDSVRERVIIRLPRTLEITVTALALGTLVGVALGVLAALRAGSWLDHLLTVGTFLSFSVPSFVLAIVGLFVLSLKVPIFPTGGLGPATGNYGLLTHLHYLALPVAVLSIHYVGTFLRFTRNAVIETLGQDYVRTARAKGLLERVVLVRHALRTALIPLVTVMALSLPGLISGATLIEEVFSWPGMGTLLLQAVAQRDYPIIVGTNLIIAALVLFSNLLADILYAVVDPRIRY